LHVSHRRVRLALSLCLVLVYVSSIGIATARPTNLRSSKDLSFIPISLPVTKDERIVGVPHFALNEKYESAKTLDTDDEIREHIAIIPGTSTTRMRMDVDVPIPSPHVEAISGPGSIKGKASWYCNYDDPDYVFSVCHYKYPDGPGPDYYAAACGKLRRAMGSDWRGKRVGVIGNGRATVVRLIDYCASEDKTIDLYRDAMDALGPSGGGYNVTVTWR